MKTAAYKKISLALYVGILFSLPMMWAQPAVPPEDGGKSSGDPTKDEIAFWREKAKSYVNKPLSLKMQFDSYRDQIQDLRRRNAELTTQISKMRETQQTTAAVPAGSLPQPANSVATPPANTVAATPPAKVEQPKPKPEPKPEPEVAKPTSADPALAQRLQEAQQQLQREIKINDSLRWTLVKIEGELEAERTKNKKMLVDLQSRKKTSEQGIKSGLIYRIQIGAYVVNELSNAGVNANDFISERSDGFNKYIIGSCRTYEEAMKMREDLRKLGIKDAWIVPYIDGERVTVAEAKEYVISQGIKPQQK